jgi:Transposase DDE domain
VVSSPRVVALRQAAFGPRGASPQARKGRSQAGAFLESTVFAVCHPQRSTSHRGCAGWAAWGKDALGWCSGFTLQLLSTDVGGLLAGRLPPATVDARAPAPALLAGSTGKVGGDRGSRSQALVEPLFPPGSHLLTTRRKDLKTNLLPRFETLGLRTRARSDRVTDHRKNSCPSAPARQRCVATSLVNVVTGGIASTAQEKEPALHIRTAESAPVPLLVL